MLRAGLPPKYAGTCRSIPQGDAQSRVASGEKAVIRLRVPADRDGELRRCRARPGVVSHRRDRRSGARPLRRHAGLQLCRGDRRCADAGDARRARRGSHLEHAAPGAAVRSVRLAAADLCPSLAGDGPRSHAALEAARRDLGRRVPRQGLPARGAGQLPGADRLVARARARRCCRSTSWRGASSFRKWRTAPACSTKTSWRG